MGWTKRKPRHDDEIDGLAAFAIEGETREDDVQEPARPGFGFRVVAAVGLVLALALVSLVTRVPSTPPPVLPAARVFTTPLKPTLAPTVEPEGVATTGSRPQAVARESATLTEAVPRAAIGTPTPPLPVLERSPTAAMTGAPSVATPPVAESAVEAAVPVTTESVAVVANARARMETESVLRAYQDSYNRMDTASLARMWPTVDTGALNRAFSTLAAQHLELGSCDVDFESSRATAECTGTVRYVPRVGDPTPRVVRKMWTIELQRAADEWQIAAVAVR